MVLKYDSARLCWFSKIMLMTSVNATSENKSTSMFGGFKDSWTVYLERKFSFSSTQIPHVFLCFSLDLFQKFNSKFNFSILKKKAWQTWPNRTIYKLRSRKNILFARSYKDLLPRFSKNLPTDKPSMETDNNKNRRYTFANNCCKRNIQTIKTERTNATSVNVCQEILSAILAFSSSFCFLISSWRSTASVVVVPYTRLQLCFCWCPLVS